MYFRQLCRDDELRSLTGERSCSVVLWNGNRNFCIFARWQQDEQILYRLYLIIMI